MDRRKHATVNGFLVVATTILAVACGGKVVERQTNDAGTVGSGNAGIGGSGGWHDANPGGSGGWGGAGMGGAGMGGAGTGGSGGLGGAGTGGSGGWGDAGTAGTGNLPCDELASDECSQCVATTCCKEFTACLYDPEHFCETALYCMETCYDDASTCAQKCDDGHFNVPFNNLFNCMSTQCLAHCSA